ncbi:MAG: hypothetical protein V7K50_19940 [Nostoc sp.]|uniref:hypothetical protein n=1 Tax=Nostoc sp. TaxID=1180 RepID=UPI002FF4DE17
MLSEVETRLRILEQIVSSKTGLARQLLQVGIAAQRTASAMQLPRGTRKVNAWGESHLWSR